MMKIKIVYKGVLKKVISSFLIAGIIIGGLSTAFAAKVPEGNESGTYEKPKETTTDRGNPMEPEKGWYYNTGTSIPSGVTPNYNRYQLLDKLQPGDIVYETKGGFRITGHIGIVEGIFRDEATGQRYVRIVEAISSAGVTRSILDDDRVADRIDFILRVPNLTQSQKDSAVNFAISQLGKDYKLDLKKDYSPDEPDWYCSELVWAAYYNQGVDIETNDFITEPGVTPHDIFHNEELIRVDFK